MHKYRYENHIISNPLLPFIFHRRHCISQRNNVPNWHKNIEVLYCIEGSGFVNCETETTRFDPTDIFVVNPDTPHTIISDTFVAYRCLIIDEQFCEENGIPVQQLIFQKYIKDPELCQLFEAVTEAYDRKESESVCTIADIRYAVLGLLRKLCSTYAVPGQRDDHADEYVKKAISYIRQNFTEHIALEDVAAYAGISKFHLSRQFRAYTGSTVIATVNLIRCTEARRLIEGGMPVAQAATACGYDNLSYFTRTFKKHFESLPSDFTPKKITVSN